jgi:trans-2-enoyl-CoA reductase
MKTASLFSYRRPTKVPTFTPKRFLSVSSAKAIMFEKYGKPEDVLQLSKVDLPSTLGPSEVLIQMKAVPINNADLNIIEGLYGNRPTLPYVGGTEGFGIVVEKGSNVVGLNVNDPVIPLKAGGTWRTHSVYKEAEVLKVPTDIPKEYLATLSAPCTALRLLEDFVDLKPGDVIIQNAANGLVGSSVYQIAAARGIKTINIIRTRADVTLLEKMKLLGAHIVMEQDYFLSGKFRSIMSDLPKPKLALNAVGGETATEMVRWLSEGGTMVSYGAMTKQPIVTAASHLIFNDISLRGFWLSKWLENHSLEDRKKMLETIYDIYRSDKLKLWMETWDFMRFPDALTRHKADQRARKVVLTVA